MHPSIFRMELHPSMQNHGMDSDTTSPDTLPAPAHTPDEPVTRLPASADMWRTACLGMPDGFVLGEVLDGREAGGGLRLLDMNEAFRRQFGNTADLLPAWMQRCAEVARTQESILVEHEELASGRHYELLSFSPASSSFSRATSRRESSSKPSWPNANGTGMGSFPDCPAWSG